MSTLGKIVATVAVLIVFFVLFGIITTMRTAAGWHTPGLIGIIMFCCMVAGIRAIWKK